MERKKIDNCFIIARRQTGGTWSSAHETEKEIHTGWPLGPMMPVSPDTPSTPWRMKVSQTIWWSIRWSSDNVSLRICEDSALPFAFLLPSVHKVLLVPVSLLGLCHPAAPKSIQNIFVLQIKWLLKIQLYLKWKHITQTYRLHGY